MLGKAKTQCQKLNSWLCRRLFSLVFSKTVITFLLLKSIINCDKGRKMSLCFFLTTHSGMCFAVGAVRFLQAPKEAPWPFVARSGRAGGFQEHGRQWTFQAGSYKGSYKAFKVRRCPRGISVTLAVLPHVQKGKPLPCHTAGAQQTVSLAVWKNKSRSLFSS